MFSPLTVVVILPAIAVRSALLSALLDYTVINTLSKLAWDNGVQGTPAMGFNTYLTFCQCNGSHILIAASNPDGIVLHATSTKP